MLEQVRIPEARHVLDALSASALRRHAPARDDRDGAVVPPALLIADEPTTALDVTIQAQILTLIRAAAGRDAHGGDVHHARHGRRRRSRRPRRRHVPRREGRGRHRRARSSSRRSNRTRARCSRPCRKLGAMRGSDSPRKFPLPADAAPHAAPSAAARRARRPSRRRTAAARARPDDALRRASPASSAACARRVHAVEQVSFDLARRRDAGAGRRIGLRQVDHRPLAAAPGRHRRRQHRVRRPRHRRAAGRCDVRPRAPRHPDDLPGSVRLARSAAHRRILDRRAAVRPRRGERPRSRGARRVAARARRAAAGARAALSARILRRPAAADRDRARAGAATQGSSSPTRRCRRSTCRSRRRSSTCCSTCRRSSALPICSSRTTWRSSSASATASR